MRLLSGAVGVLSSSLFAHLSSPCAPSSSSSPSPSAFPSPPPLFLFSFLSKSVGGSPSLWLSVSLAPLWLALLS